MPLLNMLLTQEMERARGYECVFYCSLAVCPEVIHGRNTETREDAEWRRYHAQFLSADSVKTPSNT